MAAGSKSILIIGHVWPQPQISAAGSRMAQLIHSFTRAGYTTYFASPADPPRQTPALEALHIKSLYLPLNRQQASDTIRDLQPDIVLFDRFMTEEQFAWRVQEEAPHALRILNTEDLHSLRQARHAALEQGVHCDLSFWLQQEITLRELASILRSDLSLIISGSECNWLAKTELVPREIIFYLPFMYDSIKSYKTHSYNNYSNRSDFVFFGYGKHHPNADAVRFMVNRIWPGIRKKLPGVSLAVYGKNYPSDIQELHNPKEGISIEGWQENLDPLIARARVNLVPLRFGAGLKGKIVHALQHGTPSIMTAIAAEGLFDSPGYERWIAEDPEEFAQKAVQLYEDETLWKDAVARGRAHLAKELDLDLHHKKLHTKLDQLHKGLETHRNKQLISRMLNYQGLLSARYMAKWIEAKNTT